MWFSFCSRSNIDSHSTVNKFWHCIEPKLLLNFIDWQHFLKHIDLDVLTVFYLQDFGYVRTTSTEMLKSYVFNEPIVVDAARLQSLGPASIFMVWCHLIGQILQ
jgi:hypothetical protein